MAEFINDIVKLALETGIYECSQCGAIMEFEDDDEDTLICPKCGFCEDLDMYGHEDDYDELYPTEDEVNDEYEEDDEDDYEIYYEENDELSNHLDN